MVLLLECFGAIFVLGGNCFFELFVHCTKMKLVAVGPLLAELDKCWPGPSDSLAYQAIKEKIAKESEHHDENSPGNLDSLLKFAVLILTF